MILGVILSSKWFLELASNSGLRCLAPKWFLELYLAPNDIWLQMILASNSTIRISTQFWITQVTQVHIWFGVSPSDFGGSIAPLLPTFGSHAVRRHLIKFSVSGPARVLTNLKLINNSRVN
jgi:hypothetical protein